MPALLKNAIGIHVCSFMATSRVLYHKCSEVKRSEKPRRYVLNKGLFEKRTKRVMNKTHIKRDPTIFNEILSTDGTLISVNAASYTSIYTASQNFLGSLHAQRPWVNFQLRP